VSLFGIYSNEFTFHIGTEGVIFREKGGKCKARIENDGPKKKKTSHSSVGFTHYSWLLSLYWCITHYFGVISL
jgi:hypothetical protein